MQYQNSSHVIDHILNTDHIFIALLVCTTILLTNSKVFINIPILHQPLTHQEEPEYGSANSKEKLVTRWLGRHQAPAGTGGGAAPGAGVGAATARRRGVRKQRKPPPLVLLPAHPASTVSNLLPSWMAKRLYYCFVFGCFQV